MQQLRPQEQLLIIEIVLLFFLIKVLRAKNKNAGTSNLLLISTKLRNDIQAVGDSHQH